MVDNLAPQGPVLLFHVFGNSAARCSDNKDGLKVLDLLRQDIHGSDYSRYWRTTDGHGPGGY